jgi:hypothetical protein
MDFAYVKFTDLETTEEVILSIIDDKNPYVKKLTAIITDLKTAADKANMSIEQYIIDKTYKEIMKMEVLDF